MASGSSRASGGAPRDARLLALVPLGVAIVLGALLLPRSAPPEEVPLPRVDMRALAQIRREDHARADAARRAPLPGEVRALGSAIRDFNLRQARDEDEAHLVDARHAITAALSPALDAGGKEALAALRAVQLESFVAEVRAFEATGAESDELAAVGGPFVRRMRDAGWVRGRQVLMGDDALRTAFKLTWDSVVGVEGALAPTLDEQRALYAFYLAHPHATEAVRDRLALARASASDAAACARIDEAEAFAAEAWRIDKIKRLAALDPAYPAAFALGVAQFRRGTFEASVESFRDWLRAHPDGPYALRARNHLRAALDEARR